ncbi:hypothetical protein BKA62DRAFT_694788 [Auriculariales sp. MPI-PUGE-AT-0066]|nr:hypothetical protein BKA62DRAFT_694788 [Auriculariales sp. MPI-PUGE-AT-0066]
MSSGVPWGKFAAVMGACVGVGYVLMRTTVPTDDELYRRMAPDIRRKVDAARAQRLRDEAAARGEVPPEAANLQQPDPQKPNWAGR